MSWSLSWTHVFKNNFKSNFKNNFKSMTWSDIEPVISELTWWSGSLTWLASDLGRTRHKYHRMVHKYLCMVHIKVAYNTRAYRCTMCTLAVNARTSVRRTNGRQRLNSQYAYSVRTSTCPYRDAFRCWLHMVIQLRYVGLVINARSNKNGQREI